MPVKKQQNQTPELKTQNDQFQDDKTQDSGQETARRHDVRSEYKKVSSPESRVSSLIVLDFEGKTISLIISMQEEKYA